MTLKNYNKIFEVLADLTQPANTPTIVIFDKTEHDAKEKGDRFWTRGVRLNPEILHPFPRYVIQFYQQLNEDVSIIKLGRYSGCQIHEIDKKRWRIIIKNIEEFGYTVSGWMQFMQTQSMNSARIIREFY